MRRLGENGEPVPWEEGPSCKIVQVCSDKGKLSGRYKVDFSSLITAAQTSEEDSKCLDGSEKMFEG